MRNRTENQIGPEQQIGQEHQIEETHQFHLTLIRHGKTKANEERRYLGRTDEELSEAGKQELLALKDAMRYPVSDRVDVVAASPMKRCRQTAELLCPGKKLLIMEEFREMDFGVFEGKNYEELRGDARYQAWIDSNGTLPFPEGESQESFRERCRSGFLHMLEQLDRIRMEKQQKAETAVAKENSRETAFVPGKRIAVSAVVHGGTIMALLSAYGEGDYFDYQCENGRGYQCEVCYRLDSGKEILPESIALTKIRRL